jgi:hypothetical protein
MADEAGGRGEGQEDAVLDVEGEAIGVIQVVQEDDDDEDDDEGDDDDEEEEEESEPKLKYQRLGSSVATILKTDTAKCLVPNEKFLVLGTASGKVHILDLVGNEIMRLDLHTSAVNDMSLDEAGEFLATCSDDGTVVITDLWSESAKRTKHSYHRPVLTVGLPDNYKTTQMFAAGGMTQQFIINTKAWFSNRDNVIHSGEGPIYAISWKGDLIAWANNLGVKIYDCKKEERVAFVSRPKDSPAAHVYRCHLCWLAYDTLIIGWADSVKVGVIKTRPAGGVSGQAAPKTYLQITSMFQTDFYVSGIAPFGKSLALLAHVVEEDEGDAGEGKGGVENQRPELRLMSLAAEELSSDALPIEGFEQYQANDYKLRYLQTGTSDEDALYYIVSPHDIVMARPRDADDHVAWLLARGLYERAVAAAEEHKESLKQHKFNDVAGQYLDSLFEEGDYETAAASCPRLLLRNAALWEKRVSLFAQHRQIKAISPYIPVVQPQLSEYIYEMVYLDTHIHTHTHTRTHTHRHAHTRTHIYINAHNHAHTRIHTRALSEC